MITAFLIIGMIILIGGIFGLAFRLTGVVLLALFWMLKLPVALVLWILGAVCCCTIFLIPLGLILFKSGSVMLIC